MLQRSVILYVLQSSQVKDLAWCLFALAVETAVPKHITR